MNDLSNRSTGPRTPEGKTNSSQNALRHGCRSKKMVLRDEDPAEFEAHVASWFDRFRPQDPVAVLLVEETARAHWLLKRACKRLEEVEWELPGNAWNWTDEHQNLFGNFSRYKTAAERSFLRFYKELQNYYKTFPGSPEAPATPPAQHFEPEPAAPALTESALPPRLRNSSPERVHANSPHPSPTPETRNTLQPDPIAPLFPPHDETSHANLFEDSLLSEVLHDMSV